MADFGIAMAMTAAGGERLTETGMSLGTPSYMSPEQATGDRQPTPASDIYSLGSMVYEMLAGDPPFVGTNVQAVVAKLVSEPPTKLRVLRHTVTEPVSAAVDKALAKVPRDRYGSAGEFVATVERAHAAPVEPARAWPQSWQRVPKQLFAGVGVFLAVVAWFVLGPGSTGSQPAAEAPPLVILMDSPHAARVYDEETLAANGTNADVISDILLDLPIRRQRESIGPDWHRDEEILQFRPDLIVIHYSGFRQEDGTGPRARLKLLISYFVETDSRFLIYSRQDEAILEQAMENLLADLEVGHPVRFGVTVGAPLTRTPPFNME